jgi:TRAP-type C4-dicarboxylate transport system permease small subunit
MERLLKWLEWPIHAMLWVGLAAGALMMLHVSAEFTGRTVFNHPLVGTAEIVSAYYMVAAAYLPWAWVTLEPGHIKVELFTRMLPGVVAFWLAVAVKALVIAWLALFTWQSYVSAVAQGASGEVWQIGGSYLPIWPSRWVLVVAGALMGLYLVLRVVADVGRGPRPAEAGDPGT